MMCRRAIAISIPFAFVAALAALAESPPVPKEVDEPIDKDGFVTYTIDSPYQSRPTAIEVLMPDAINPDERFPVLYILPVNDGTDGPWGSGIREALRHNIQNLHRIVCVAPEYDYTPWFGDSPDEPALRQESYLLEAVIPFVESRCPVIEGRDGRILLGFSKSGFGAISLFLRHLDLIGKAAAWDAPLDSMKIFDEEEEVRRIFQTRENLAGYFIPDLLKAHAVELRSGPSRIAIVNNGSEGGSVASVHQQMVALEIPHRYAVDARREHAWTSGWLPVVVRLLLSN